MGLVKSLLLLPLGPVNGVRWVVDVLVGEAERELAERESPQRRLADLDARCANGELSDAEAEALEAELIEQLLARHGLSGGP
ncbi:gas vesicle protein GvpG [Solirubrobacter ginsenosidimutans]|uniref:Gas vesicle protein GvpG n=1 Tax=Solirubrobacter ginsenosidimutans TaxID=490573 RepID=A0A9X3N282_9ACTN|nr:gas vesicle protein GvpG [Solirubrobacter ginsenosidimutans]MDA0165680.1 gas vesicle protein GvpG [Solirubrobacter ginsenosidimutans]